MNAWISLVLCMLLCSTYCNSLHTYVFHVDAVNGVDLISTCGSEQKPCKTLDFMWNEFRTFMLMNSTNLYGDIIFMLAPGLYSRERAYQPLTFSCIETNVSEITIMGKPSSSRPVQIELGLNINFCQRVSVLNVGFTNVKQIVTMKSIGLILMENLRIKQNTYQPIFSIDDVHTMVVQNMTVSQNNLLYSHFIDDSLAYAFEFKEISTLNLTNLYIDENHHLKLLFRSVRNILNKNITIFKNQDFSIVYAESNVHSTGLNVTSNYGNLGHYIQLRYRSNGTFDNAVVDCNTYVGTTFGSVFGQHENSNITCLNCIAPGCEVKCGSGYERLGILCLKCPSGSSANEQQQRCNRCEVGHYSSSPGSAKCVACSEGTYCSKEGCTACRECRNDFFTAGKGANACSKMTTLFIVLLALVILLILLPIVIFVIKRFRSRRIGQFGNMRLLDESDDEKGDQSPVN